MLVDQYVASDLKILLGRRRCMAVLGVGLLAAGCMAVLGGLGEDRWASYPRALHGLRYNCSADFSYAHRHLASFRHCQPVRAEFRRAVAEVRQCVGVAAFCVVLAVCSLPACLAPRPPTLAPLATHLLVASAGVRALAGAHTFRSAVTGGELGVSFTYTVLGGLLCLLALLFLALRSQTSVPELYQRLLVLRERS